MYLIYNNTQVSASTQNNLQSTKYRQTFAADVGSINDFEISMQQTFITKRSTLFQSIVHDDTYFYRAVNVDKVTNIETTSRADNSTFLVFEFIMSPETPVHVNILTFYTYLGILSDIGGFHSAIFGLAALIL